MPTVGWGFPINFLKSKHSSTDMPVGQPDTNNRSLRHFPGVANYVKLFIKSNHPKTSELWGRPKRIKITDLFEEMLRALAVLPQDGD